MTHEIFGKKIGDKSYISKALRNLLLGNGIQLINAVRRNMKTKALSKEVKILLRKHSVIETVNDELKNICQVEQSRYRSLSDILLNIMSAITAILFFLKNHLSEKVQKKQILKC